ncbi:unnamed protein product [Orchesella dallaii]|uniref:Uncharacterized protein n=1 Tax=Orchesella dallaii TaxID=48710 RepID=A0ABP1PNP5_9HEXA
MDTSSITVIVLLFLMDLAFFGHALFEYICDEKQLYKPYMHVYKARRGLRILDVGPGFHEIAEYMNAYVCINGPAYLYFSKNTELGEVYEAAQLKMYAHTCEMYNVKPREGSASVVEVQLHLRAVLLLGDPVDYRRVSIQEFTAPYFFRKDQLNPHVETDPEYVPIPAHYINATSLVIIGQSECTLTKGSKNTPIKVRPFIQPPDPSPSPPVAEKGWLCKIGFGALLEKASSPPGGPTASVEDRALALALINDEAIRVERCVANPAFDPDTSAADHDEAKQEIESIDTEIEQKKADLKTDFDTLVDAVITPLNEDKTKQITKKDDPATKPKEKRRLEKQIMKLEARIKLEEDKKKEYENALTELSTELAKCKTMLDEAKVDGTKGSTAKTDKEAVDTAKKEWEAAVDGNKPQSEIDTAKTAFEVAQKKSEESAREYQWELSNLNIAMLRLRHLAEKVKLLGNYVPSPSNPRTISKSAMKHVHLNPDGSMPIVINADKDDCVPLPVLEDECKNGKPPKEPTCNLFKATLGVEDPWEVNQPREDVWKKDILQLIGDIFSTACDKIAHVKKLVTLNNRIMGHYLTDEKIFNLKSGNN